MNTWYTAGVCAPRVAITVLPNGRAPLPRSHSTYSSPPQSICTQGEWPPNVWETEKSSSFSMKRHAFCWVSSFLPDAATSARTSFACSARVVSATGNEPRVPQKRISIVERRSDRVPGEYVLRAVERVELRAHRRDRLLGDRLGRPAFGSMHRAQRPALRHQENLVRAHRED